MFNRFWKNKDDGSSKSGPPGHRGSQAGGGDAAGGGAAPAEPLGGGFFNLPPVGKGPTSYGAPGGASSTGGLQPGGGAPSQYGGTQPGGGAPSQYGRPASASGGHHSVPSYGAPQPPTSHYGQPQPPPYGSHAPPAPASGGSGGMDMFGGMSLKAPAAVPSGYGGAPQPLKPSPIKYGGYGGPHHDAPNPGAAPASGGSLFSGLDVAPVGASAAPAAPYGHDDETLRPVSERKKSIGRSSTFSSPGGTDSSAAVQRQSVGSISRPGVNKGGVKKKKTKSFRPGFGRQLSDESIAALQRGDLNPEDIIQQQQPVEESAPSAPQPPRMATNPTDLAHLLPPVKGGSVLAGLTVHDGGSTTSSSGGSVLAGLTVHGGNSPRGSSKSNASDGGGLLAGLNVHRKPSVDEQSDASTSVVLPSSGEKSSSSKKKSPPQEPEKPAAPPTPEEKMINTLRDFHASALSFRNSSLKQNEEENKILERKIQLAKQLNQYEIDLHTIEAQQQQAVEVEDFEKADALNSTINSVRHCITLSESDVRKVESELVAFVKAKEKAFINQLKSTRGTLKELEKFYDDQDAERSALRDELKKYKVEQTEHLQFEAERIDTELHHVSSNMDHLKSEKEEIEATIEEQCRADVSLREELLVEKAGVQEEILELERQLRIKEEQMRGIQASIDKAESDIDAVRSRYSRQLKRIADRKDGLSKTKAEVEADADQLKAERKEFGDTIQDYGVRIAAFGKRMKAVKKEMRAAMLLATVLEVQETRREQATVRRKQQTAELTALADSAAIAEQSFELLRKQHEELEKSLTVHHNAIASAQTMIPQLEQEKKAAAAQRNFKEAARISKDIKALEKDQSSAEEMVEVVEMELQDLKERIEKRDAEWKEKKEELKTVEKQLELNTLHELWKEAKGLRQSLRKFEKVKSEGVAAADGVDFRSSALLLVQAEYDACIAQAEALESKYEMTDPTAEEEDDDVDDEEDDDDESVDEEIDEHFAVSAVLANSDQVTGGVGPENDHGIDHTSEAPLTLEKIAERVAELEQLIEEATENEEYERAAKLDQQLGMLRQREASLKAAAESLSAGTSAGTGKSTRGNESAQVREEREEAGSGEEEEGNSAEELEEELRLVRTRIKMLEVDIERDTENEDYEAAAELEEELQQLRVDEAEITQLLAESHRQTNGNVVVGTAGAVHPEGSNIFAGLKSSIAASEAPQQPAGSSVFAGMQVAAVDTNVGEVVAGSSMFAGMQVAAVEDKKVEDEVAGSSMFAGMEVAAVDTNVGDNAAGSRMFAGMQVTAVDTNVGDEAAGSSMPAGMEVATVTTVVTDVEKVIAHKSDSDENGEERTQSPSPKETPVSPRRLSIGSGPNSPRRKSSGGMFSGLQVSSGPVVAQSLEPGTSSNAPMFEGLQVGSSGASTLTSEVSVFEGLQVGSSQVDTVKEALNSEQLFGGLTLTTKNDDTANSDDGVIVDADEVVEEEANVSLEEQQVEETTEQVSVEETTTTTTVVSTATLDMFGGLSVASAAVFAEAPTGQSGISPAPSADTASSLSMFGGLSLAPTAVATAQEAAKVEAPASPVDMFGGLSLAPAASATADVAPTVE